MTLPPTLPLILSPEVAEALAAAQAAQAAAEATPEHWDDKDEGDASAASPHDQA